jgi:hypothetical protein
MYLGREPLARWCIVGVRHPLGLVQGRDPRHLPNPRYTGYQVWNAQSKAESLLDVAIGYETRLQWNDKDVWVWSDRRFPGAARIVNPGPVGVPTESPQVRVPGGGSPQKAHGQNGITRHTAAPLLTWPCWP